MTALASKLRFFFFKRPRALYFGSWLTSVVLTEADNLLNQQAVDDKCLLAEFRSNQSVWSNAGDTS